MVDACTCTSAYSRQVALPIRRKRVLIRSGPVLWQVLIRRNDCLAGCLYRLLVPHGAIFLKPAAKHFFFGLAKSNSAFTWC